MHPRPPACELDARIYVTAINNSIHPIYCYHYIMNKIQEIKRKYVNFSLFSLVFPLIR